MKYILYILLYLYLATGGCYAIKALCNDSPEYKYMIINIAFIIFFMIFEILLWVPLILADYTIKYVDRDNYKP